MTPNDGKPPVADAVLGAWGAYAAGKDLPDERRAEYARRIVEACAKGAGWNYRPRTSAPRRGLERHEQTRLAAWLDDTVGPYGWCHPANEGQRSARMGASLKAQGMKPGIPDVLIFAVDLSRCAGIAIELKRTDGRPSDVSREQREWGAALERWGWLWRVCCGADDAIKWLWSTSAIRRATR